MLVKSAHDCVDRCFEGKRAEASLCFGLTDVSQPVYIRARKCLLDLEMRNFIAQELVLVRRRTALGG